MTHTLEFTPEEVRALAFFTSERKWRATMAHGALKMPMSERVMYDAESMMCDGILAKLDACIPQKSN